LFFVTAETSHGRRSSHCQLNGFKSPNGEFSSVVLAEDFSTVGLFLGYPYGQDFYRFVTKLVLHVVIASTNHIESVSLTYPRNGVNSSGGMAVTNLVLKRDLDNSVVAPSHIYFGSVTFSKPSKPFFFGTLRQGDMFVTIKTNRGSLSENLTADVVDHGRLIPQLDKTIITSGSILASNQFRYGPQITLNGTVLGNSQEYATWVPDSSGIFNATFFFQIPFPQKRLFTIGRILYEINAFSTNNDKWFFDLTYYEQKTLAVSFSRSGLSYFHNDSSSWIYALAFGYFAGNVQGLSTGTNYNPVTGVVGIQASINNATAPLYVNLLTIRVESESFAVANQLDSLKKKHLF